jgi:diguanylate cyclase (GGDEF)-like protein
VLIISKDRLQRYQSNAEVLLWQGMLRVGFVGVAAAAGVLLRSVGLVGGSPLTLGAMAAAYIATILAVRFAVRRRGHAGPWALSLTVAADLLFILGSTLLAASPEHHERALVLALFTVQLTEVYFGRAPALWALGAASAGYLALVAALRARGTALYWPEELWMLCIFAAGAGLLILEYGSFKRRLQRIASLFAAAEEGDFSRSYDVTADRHPDTITMVGRAYNRVRAQLATMVLTDPLSGCLNRRGFEQELTRTVARAARAGSAVALLGLDVDHFKDVNDTFGHLVGDGAIREVGALLRAAGRAGDVVARMGGDEFMMLLPDTDETGALQVAARIRDGFRERTWASLPAPHRLTMSIGVVTERAADEDLEEDLLARADEALYAAKRSGRDRIFVWQHGILRPVTGAYRLPDPAEHDAEDDSTPPD